MADTTPALLQRYLAHRRRYEIALILLFVLFETVANTLVAQLEVRRESDLALWKPAVWEISSSLLWLAIIPLVLTFDRRWPLDGGQLRRHLPRHVLLTVPVSLLHVVGMVGLRHLAYAAMGEAYRFGHWPSELFYEYLKDARSYALILAIFYFYRLVLLRLQGEVRVLAAPDIGPPVEPLERPDRFLVKKLGKEFLIAAGDIEWLEAQGNYINLHVRGRSYPLRATMAAIEGQLDATRFLRVHRSHIVNLDHLAEIVPLDTGDAQLKLRDGSVVPCSRRYRAALRARGAAVESAPAA